MVGRLSASPQRFVPISGHKFQNMTTPINTKSSASADSPGSAQLSAHKHALQDIHDFWNTEACGTHFVREASSEAEFYERFREERYRSEWHIPLLVPFAEAKGKDVLEIGIGNGADAAMFAMHGGTYTGIDLTEAAIDATRRHFQVLGLAGTFEIGNAEALALADDSFDIVYSHGVLHHTRNIQKALAEVHRVLRPGGQAIVMLYHRRSFNYYVRIMGFMRARVLLTILSRITSWRVDRRRINATALQGVRGNEDRRVWDIHYDNFLREGWDYLRPTRFVHHSTDGPECPVANVYTKNDARQLFAGFQRIRLEVAHLPVRRYWRWFPLSIEKLLARHWGWYLFISATKAR